MTAKGKTSRVKSRLHLWSWKCAWLLMGVAVATLSMGCQSLCPAPEPEPVSKKDARLNATLWFQGAESAALYFQSFTLARRALDEQLALPATDKPRVIITDIDETVLDNSAYQAWLIKTKQPYSPKTWKEWTALASAPALPGASNFLSYAASRGVRVFYVTNRDQDEADATLKNLREAGFPNAEPQFLLCKQSDRSKETRRQQIAATNTVCLLLGDNLADLAAAFDVITVDARQSAVARSAKEFGTRWILFPNPMYGDWERAQPAGRLREAPLP